MSEFIELTRGDRRTMYVLRSSITAIDPPDRDGWNRNCRAVVTVAGEKRGVCETPEEVLDLLDMTQQCMRPAAVQRTRPTA